MGVATLAGQRVECNLGYRARDVTSVVPSNVIRQSLFGAVTID